MNENKKWVSLRQLQVQKSWGYPNNAVILCICLGLLHVIYQELLKPTGTGGLLSNRRKRKSDFAA